MPDWAVRLQTDGKYLVAHELGHASGITGHFLIDYDLDDSIDLEEGSLMQADTGNRPPTLTDYNFMIEQQGQIMQDHLNDSSGTLSDPCD